MRLRRTDTTCGHHWHVVDTGWQCCCCPGKVKAKRAPAPEPGTAVCQAPPVREIAAWLGPAPLNLRPARRSRPGRRHPHLSARRPT